MKLTTTVYKYKPYAPIMLIVLSLGTVFLFFALDGPLGIIGVVLLVCAPIYGALRPNSIFSLRSVDEKKLVMTPDELIHGNLRIPISELKKLVIYIHAFDAFKHHAGGAGGRKMRISEYGDRNTISFLYHGIRYDYTFYLGSFNHYDTLVRIIQNWRDKGILISARSAFTDSYIREQVTHYNQGNVH